ncbi:hypothetical protein GVK82_12610 [Enterococcus hirae]|uniref:WxL domain-containing protein n=1 Tax=Enterococcus hirae TaxID=1354 RepID=UPI001377BFBA|nr:WxL domain-containing protein [Enterococcus hirae]NBA19040.1 hypothetical protein [Enterococcus hirae]
MKKQALVAALGLIAPVIVGTGSVFADTATTNVTANFTVPTINNDNPQPNNPAGSSPGASDDNTNLPLNPTGNFALAYVPNNLNFGDIELGSSGAKKVDISLTQGDTLNVGVKDTMHDTNGWNLTASFSGALASNGVTISTTASTAKLNDGGVLKSLPDENMISVNSNFTVNSSDSTVMTGVQGHNFAGTYDLDLGTVSLNIPDVSAISAGQTNGLITWNLSQTPQNNG